MLTVEEIQLYLLQSGSKETLEKLMAKNPNLDLSCLDDEDEPMLELDSTRKVVEKQVKKVTEDVANVTGSEQEAKQEIALNERVDREVDVSSEIEGVILLTFYP